MFSFKLDKDEIYPFDQIEQILSRMGWSYDESHGILTVNAPIDDEMLVEFIFGAFM